MAPHHGLVISSVLAMDAMESLARRHATKPDPP
jgi:hypothetical protein